MRGLHNVDRLNAGFARSRGLQIRIGVGPHSRKEPCLRARLRTIQHVLSSRPEASWAHIRNVGAKIGTESGAREASGAARGTGLHSIRTKVAALNHCYFRTYVSRRGGLGLLFQRTVDVGPAMSIIPPRFEEQQPLSHGANRALRARKRGWLCRQVSLGRRGVL